MVSGRRAAASRVCRPSSELMRACVKLFCICVVFWIHLIFVRIDMRVCIIICNMRAPECAVRAVSHNNRLCCASQPHPLMRNALIAIIAPVDYNLIGSALELYFTHIRLVTQVLPMGLF